MKTDYTYYMYTQTTLTQVFDCTLRPEKRQWDMHSIMLHDTWRKIKLRLYLPFQVNMIDQGTRRATWELKALTFIQYVLEFIPGKYTSLGMLHICITYIYIIQLSLRVLSFICQYITSFIYYYVNTVVQFSII